jgi:hypothetical protein
VKTGKAKLAEQHIQVREKIQEQLLRKKAPSDKSSDLKESIKMDLEAYQSNLKNQRKTFFGRGKDSDSGKSRRDKNRLKSHDVLERYSVLLKKSD